MNIRDEVEKIVAWLGGVTKVCRIYGPEHKLTKEALDTLYKVLSDVMSERKEITVGIIGDEIAFEKGAYSIPVYPSVVIDTTGAGDSFLGAFVSMFLKEEDPLWCASMGAAVSSCVIETHGVKIKRNKRDIEDRAQRIFQGIKRI